MKLFASANPLQRSSAGGLIGLACADLICLGSLGTNWKTVHFHVFLFCSAGLLSINLGRPAASGNAMCATASCQRQSGAADQCKAGGSAEFDAHNPL